MRSFSSLFYRAEYYVRPIDWPSSYRNSESRESTYVCTCFFFLLFRCDQQRPFVRILRDVLMNYSFVLCMALIILTFDHSPDPTKCPLNELIDRDSSAEYFNTFEKPMMRPLRRLVSLLGSQRHNVCIIDSVFPKSVHQMC